MTSTYFKERAYNVISVAFGGLHRVGEIKWNDYYCKFTVRDGIATYDYNCLTKLVVASHDECIRATLSNGGPRRLLVTLYHRTRKSKHPDMCAHPTLEKHVEAIRRGGSMQWLLDEMREELA